TAPSPLLTNIIASDRMEIVQSAAGNIDDDWESLSRAPWVLNPSGCLLRASLIDQMERAGFTPMVAAEIHYNIHLQLALIQSGYGVVDFSRSEEHTSELQSRSDLVCRLLLEKKNSGPRD